MNQQEDQIINFASRSECDEALQEIKRFHFTYLNSGYHPDVYDDWKKGGCYNKIADNLGYRLRIDFQGSILPEVLPKDRQYQARIKIENIGVSRILNKKTTKILVKGAKDHEFQLSDDLRMVKTSANECCM